MKRKFKITFEVTCDYPGLEKETKQLSKDFDRWLKDWSSKNGPAGDLVPALYPNQVEYMPNNHVKVKIVRDKETILKTSWKEDFEGNLC